MTGELVIKAKVDLDRSAVDAFVAVVKRCERYRKALDRIARFADSPAAMATAMMLHYDMAGIASEALKEPE